MSSNWGLFINKLVSHCINNLNGGRFFYASINIGIFISVYTPVRFRVNPVFGSFAFGFRCLKGGGESGGRGGIPKSVIDRTSNWSRMSSILQGEGDSRVS